MGVSQSTAGKVSKAFVIIAGFFMVCAGLTKVDYFNNELGIENPDTIAKGLIVLSIGFMATSTIFAGISIGSPSTKQFLQIGAVSASIIGSVIIWFRDADMLALSVIMLSTFFVNFSLSYEDEN